MAPEAAVLSACTQELSGLAELDNDVFDYIVSLLGDSDDPSKAFAVEGLTETISPFLSSSGFVEMEEEAEKVVERLSKALMMNVGLREECSTGKELYSNECRCWSLVLFPATSCCFRDILEFIRRVVSFFCCCQIYLFPTANLT